MWQAFDVLCASNIMVESRTHSHAPGQWEGRICVAEAAMSQAESLVQSFRDEIAQTARVPPSVQLHSLRVPPWPVHSLDHGTALTGREDLLRAETLVPLQRLEYLSDTPRVLWLDVDTIAQVDLAALYRMPLDGRPVAAVSETKTLPTLRAVAQAAREELGIRLPVRRKLPRRQELLGRQELLEHPGFDICGAESLPGRHELLEHRDGSGKLPRRQELLGRQEFLNILNLTSEV